MAANDGTSAQTSEQQRLKAMLRNLELEDKAHNHVYGEFLTSGAVLACQYGVKKQLLGNSSLKYTKIGNDEVLIDKDVLNENNESIGGTFGVCKSPKFDGLSMTKTIEISASESLDGIAKKEGGHTCYMQLAQKWSSLSKEIVVYDPSTQEYREIPTTNSYILCYYGQGCVYPIDSGQRVTVNSTEELGNSKFKMLVDRYQSYYTNFTVDGTVAPPGQTISFQLPYFISSNGVYGGKSSYKSIQDAIRNKYYNTATGNWTGTAEQIQSSIHAAPTNEKKNYGIDCSGLVYFVLNESTKVNESDDMTTGALYAQFKSTYANGVSAAALTSTDNGIRILKAEDIVVGCTMRSDGGGHVLVVYKVDKDSNGIVETIHYAHSNGSCGPHTASITIGDQSKDLGDSSQTWNDIAYTDTTAKKLYNHTILLNNLQPYK